MNTSNQGAPASLRSLRRLLLIGLTLAVVGGMTSLVCSAFCRSIDKNYAKARSSQFYVRVEPSRNSQPWNSYLPWGPTRIYDGYSGPDPKKEFEARKTPYLIVRDTARTVGCLGLGLAVVGFAGCRLVIARHDNSARKSPSNTGNEPESAQRRHVGDGANADRDAKDDQDLELRI